MKNSAFILFILLFCSLDLKAQWDTIQIKTISLTSDIHVLKGRGGNIGVFTGEDGVFMIDSQFGPLSEKILNAVRELSDAPVRFLFNTHWHGDHTGGNENIHDAGATVIAHENVYKRLKAKEIKKADGTVENLPAGALPEITFDHQMYFHINGKTVRVIHFHDGGHTDGDAIVYFEADNILHMGDLFFESRYPYIDISSGGNVDDLISTLNQSLLLVNDDTRIIPGHGIITNRASLMTYRDMIHDVRNKVKAQVDAGKTLEEIQEMELSKAYDEKYGGGFIKKDRFITAIYRSFRD
ncbi:MAG: MBL fold metallo-hydrolase [Bacteroidota bacterium]